MPWKELSIPENVYHYNHNIIKKHLISYYISGSYLYVDVL